MGRWVELVSLVEEEQTVRRGGADRSNELLWVGNGWVGGWVGFGSFHYEFDDGVGGWVGGWFTCSWRWRL